MVEEKDFERSEPEMDQNQTPAKVGRPCTICASTHRIAVDNALLDGTAISRVSRDYNVSPDSIRRHARAHLAPEARGALRGPESLSTSDLVARILDVADSARDARQGLEDAGQGSAALKAGAAEVRALDALMTRLGVDDLEVLDQLRDGERLARAIGLATRANPHVGHLVATRLRDLGSEGMADDLEQHSSNAQHALDLKAVKS